MKAVDELFQPSQGNTEWQTPLTSSGSLINLTRMPVDGGRNPRRTCELTEMGSGQDSNQQPFGCEVAALALLWMIFNTPEAVWVCFKGNRLIPTCQRLFCYRADINAHYGRSQDECVNPVFFQAGLIVQETCFMTKKWVHTSDTYRVKYVAACTSQLPRVRMERCNSAAARCINGNTNRGGGLSHTGAFMKDHCELLDADMLTGETHHWASV